MQATGRPAAIEEEGRPSATFGVEPECLLHPRVVGERRRRSRASTRYAEESGEDMGIHQMIQTAASVANVLTVIVFAVGYYFMIRLYREWINQSRESRVAGGRPQVVVAVDYSHLPQVTIKVRNFNKAPAKDISFEFSAPIEDAEGNVISDLPYFKKGLDFMEPEGSVSRHWGRLPDLAPILRERGLENGIKVTTRYKDLAGESYESAWKLDPLLFEGSGIENSKGMNDLVNAVEQISERVEHQNGNRV